MFRLSQEPAANVRVRPLIMEKAALDVSWVRRIPQRCQPTVWARNFPITCCDGFPARKHAGQYMAQNRQGSIRRGHTLPQAKFLQRPLFDERLCDISHASNTPLFSITRNSKGCSDLDLAEAELRSMSAEPAHCLVGKQLAMSRRSFIITATTMARQAKAQGSSQHVARPSSTKGSCKLKRTGG